VVKDVIVNIFIGVFNMLLTILPGRLIKSELYFIKLLLLIYNTLHFINLKSDTNEYEYNFI